MTESLLERTGEQFAETARKGSQGASAVVDALQEGIGAAQQAAKQSGDAAEKAIGQAARRLKPHPMETALAIFASGVAAGALIGWKLNRR